MTEVEIKFTAFLFFGLYSNLIFTCKLYHTAIYDCSIRVTAVLEYIEPIKRCGQQDLHWLLRGRGFSQRYGKHV